MFNTIPDHGRSHLDAYDKTDETFKFKKKDIRPSGKSLIINSIWIKSIICLTVRSLLHRIKMFSTSRPMKNKRYGIWFLCHCYACAVHLATWQVHPNNQEYKVTDDNINFPFTTKICENLQLWQLTGWVYLLSCKISIFSLLRKL